jgi:hypothetical protein
MSSSIEWVPCPGGVVAEYDPVRQVGVCPECGFVVHTLFAGGTIAPHEVGDDGRLVRFTPR